MKRLAIALLLLLHLSAWAYECIPGIYSADWTPGKPNAGVSANGAWLQWTCASKTSTVVRTITFVTTRAAWETSLSTLASILSSPDPLAALNAAASRILPIDDPAFASVLTDMTATPLP